mgnify:FL=1
MRDVAIIHREKDLGALTVSVGVASWPESGEKPLQILTLADRALYRAKEAGRNRIEIFG